MNRITSFSLLTFLLAPLLLNAPRTEAQNSFGLTAGTQLEVVITKALDAGKNKTGDVIPAKVLRDVKAGGVVVIPKGSRLIGHVTEASRLPKGAALKASEPTAIHWTTDMPHSVIKISFDQAILKNGSSVPLNVTIQALAKPEDPSIEYSDFPRGPQVNQVGPSVGGNTLHLAEKVGAATTATLTTEGVIGYYGLVLDGTSVYSPVQNVHLDNGTAMILTAVEKQ